MNKGLVILDFDGTITDVDQEAIPFVENYKENMANDLGISRENLEQRWLKAQKVIESNPSRYGWLSNGKIVAPAYADPLIMSRTIAGLLLDEANRYSNNNRLANSSSREIVLDEYFKKSYPYMGIVFKKDADNFLTTLSDSIDTCIVTNSKTDGVRKKISHLPTGHFDIPIYGDAKKYLLDDTWNDAPESVSLEGFGRPLFLRRQKYYETLEMVKLERQVGPYNVFVVGDVYELDLLLPAYMRMNIILTPRKSTPQFEIDAVKSSQFGKVAYSLNEVLDHILV